MSSLKKFSVKGTLRQVFICLRPRTPYPPPTGKGGEAGRVEPERKVREATVHKAGSKYLHD